MSAEASPPHLADDNRRFRLEAGHLYRAIILAFLLAIVFVHFDAISQVFLLIYAAAILGVAFNAVAQRLPLHRKWVAGIIAVAFLATLGGLAYILVPALMDQIRTFAERIPEYEERLREWGDWVREQTGLDVALVGPQTAEALQNFFAGLDTEAIFGRARGLLEILVFPFLIVLGGLFVLANPNDRLLTPVLRTVPRDMRDDVRRIFKLLGTRLLGWIRGTLIAMVSVGVLATVAFSVIGVPNALLLGTIAGLTEFVPIIGPWIGGAPAVVIALLDDPTKALWTLAAVIVIQFLESNVITPWAMSQAAHIHPLITLFALLLFGSIFGFLGVLLAVPIVILIWTTVEVLWVDRKILTGSDELEPVVKE